MKSSERDFGIDADDFRKAAEALERAGFDRRAGQVVAGAIRKSANAVRRNVRAQARPHRRTGRLNSLVRVRLQGYGMDLQARVKSGGPVAHLITGGVKPHEITLESKDVMTIRAPGRAGAVVGFATVVQHPGVTADPYFMRGVRASAPEINAIVGTAADTMARELADRMEGKS